MKHCVIVGASPEPAIPIIYTEESFVICADGGVVTAAKQGVYPDVIVGDGDSTQSIPPEFAGVEVIRLPQEKDDTDLIYAVKLGLFKGCKEFSLYGASGGRFDHTIANLQTLSYLCDHGATGVVESTSHRFFLIQNTSVRVPKKEGWYLSVFSYTERCSGVSETGVKYPLDNVVLDQSFPLGVSNEITEEVATITVKNGKMLLVQARMD